MSSCTIIIPTLQLAEAAINFMIPRYEKSKSIEKVIIINNALEDKFSPKYKNLKKIHIIHDQPNLFVNPAWNYGMKLVKSKYYALINDDIFFHTDLIGSIINLLEKNENINLSTVKTKISYNHNEIIKEMQNNKFKANISYEIKKYPEEIKQGWFMLGRTKDWKEIPELHGNIMYGDDFIYIENQKKYEGACIITNNIVYHMESTSVHKSREIELMKKISKPW